MAFQLALGCTGGGVHRVCCDECDPTECSITAVHEADGSVTITWTYSSPYVAVTAAELNGSDVLGDPYYETDTVNYPFGSIPETIVLEVVNSCGTSTCEYNVPCCWRYDTLRISFQNVDDIALSCFKTYPEPFPRPLVSVTTYNYQLSITGLTALNGTWFLDMSNWDCEIDAGSDVYIGDITYDWDLFVSGKSWFGVLFGKTYEEHYWGTLTGSLYIRGMNLIFVPASDSFTDNFSIWPDTSDAGTFQSFSVSRCLGGNPANPSDPCPTDLEFFVGSITQPNCDDVPTYFLETAYFLPFGNLIGSSILYVPPVVGASGAATSPPLTTRCPGITDAIPLEVDVEYV